MLLSRTRKTVINTSTGLEVLAAMKAFWSLLDRKMFSCNPIDVAEMMAATDEYWYCPFAYGYSNYARNGYARNCLPTPMVTFNGNKTLRSTLGGTGLAVSAFSPQASWAVRFAAWVVSPQIQSTLYVQHGGQPGHRYGWTNDAANNITHHYFRNTLDAVDRAYVSRDITVISISRIMPAYPSSNT